MSARILLIEDNPANLELMSYLLKAFGYITLTAVDGAEGLATVIRAVPDLILCDIQLPIMDGLAVAQRIKADPTLARIPLVAITALAMVGDRDRVLAVGFDGYITKPIDPETFIQKVEMFLGRVRRSTPAKPDEQQPGLPTAAGTGPTILVVDNLPVNLELARSIFEPHGYRVITAAGISAALQMARHTPCDLILSDVCMAGESGYDLIKAVKADPLLAAIPFVFLTSTMLDKKDLLRGLALGAVRFLTRPIEPQELLAEITACLREKENG